MTKILFISPPYHTGVVESAGVWLPLGLLYLAGAVRDRGLVPGATGFDPVVYDAMSYNHTHADIRKMIAETKPFAVCTGAFTASYPDALEILKSAKAIDPSIYTILGGVHSSFLPAETPLGDYVDFVVRGEGEETLPELLDCLSAGGSLDKVNGISFFRDGAIQHNPARCFIADLDRLTPAFDLVDWPRYKYRAHDDARLAIVSSSRGCCESCSFCSQRLFWNETWRGRTPEHFLAELECLADRFGVKVVMIADETPTYERERWEKIITLLIERNLGMKILLETRVKDIIRDRDLLSRYVQAGVEHIYTGVESAFQNSLDYYKKKISCEESKQAIDLINGHDMVSETSFVLGRPQDTVASFRETADLAGYYNADMTFFLALTPWPYTELYRDVRDRIRVFDYRRYNLIEPVIEPETMSLAEVDREMTRATMNFYKNKFMSFAGLSPFKRDYMLKVMRILKENSYLKNKFREAGMPQFMLKPGIMP